MQAKINNHIKDRNLQERRAIVAENCKTTALAVGGRQMGINARTGLGLTGGTMEPAVPADIPDEQRAWSCPYCSLGLPELGTRWQMEVSKRLHLAQAHPGKSMKRAYDDYRKKFRTMHREKYRQTCREQDGRKQQREEALKANRDKWGADGHEIEYCPVDFRDKARGKRPREKHCRKCRVNVKGLKRREREGHACPGYAWRRGVRLLPPQGA